ncbi:hypothetical protein JZU54_00960, partial [bacterium]|nr:hypothetical protein [bacterium]
MDESAALYPLTVHSPMLWYRNVTGSGVLAVGVMSSASAPEMSGRARSSSRRNAFWFQCRAIADMGGQIFSEFRAIVLPTELLMSTEIEFMARAMLSTSRAFFSHGQPM